MLLTTLTLAEDGRTGTFAIGGDSFPASLLDLPTVVESYKTYDDTNLVKTADIGQVMSSFREFPCHFSYCCIISLLICTHDMIDNND